MQKGVDFIGVTVSFYCHDGKGNFVMARRSEKCRDEHGKWDIGGGGLEFGDNLEERLEKEIQEEYCTDILNVEFLGVRDVHRINAGKATHWIALYYKVLVDREKVKIGEPHKFSDIKWFNIQNPPQENVHSEFPNFLAEYKDKLVS